MKTQLPAPNLFVVKHKYWVKSTRIILWKASEIIKKLLLWNWKYLIAIIWVISRWFCNSSLFTGIMPVTLLALCRSGAERVKEGEFLIWLCWGLTSQSTIFQSCRDGAIASWEINQYFRGVKCLAQGHNTAAVGLEPRTSRSGVRHSILNCCQELHKAKNMK